LITAHCRRPAILGACAGFAILFASCATASKPVEQPRPGKKTLIDLITAGKTAELKQRFTTSDSVNQKNAKGQSLLHIAALRNDADIVQFLLAMKLTRKPLTPRVRPRFFNRDRRGLSRFCEGPGRRRGKDYRR
jgi:hypothetical protein